MFCLFRISGSPTWSQKVQGFILTAWLGLWIQQTSGADVITAAVGETVTITPQFSGTVISCIWFRGTAALADKIILTYIGSRELQRPGPQYTDRETGLSDGSLRIRDVLTNYTGNYTAIILTQDGASETVTKQLRVYVTGPPLCNRCSCWEVTLGATIGVFLCATAVIAGVVFYYKRLLNQKETRKVPDDFTYHNHSINQKPETQYENVTKGHKTHLANQPTVTDSPYMDLQHGDRATYEQIKR